MPFNGAGVFQRVRNWVADAAAGIKIRADFHDVEDDGFAAGISNCIAKDGQTTITQNIPFNAKRITNLADPVNDQDAATKKIVDAVGAGRVLKAGDTMTGNLVIEKASPSLILNTLPAGGANTVVGQETGLARWTLHLGDGTAEATGDVGSDFALESHTSAGAHLQWALQGSRATGLLTVTAVPTAPLGIATKSYVDVKVNKAGDTMTGGPLTSFGSGPGIVNPSLSTAFNVWSTAGNPQAYMSFFAQGFFGANFGISADGNFYMGGISHNANSYQFWTKRDFPTAPVINTRLATYGDINMNTAAVNTIYEPIAGGVVTGWQYAVDGSGSSVVTVFRVRLLQVMIGNGTWVTVGLG